MMMRFRLARRSAACAAVGLCPHLGSLVAQEHRTGRPSSSACRKVVVGVWVFVVVANPSLFPLLGGVSTDDWRFRHNWQTSLLRVWEDETLGNLGGTVVQRREYGAFSTMPTDAFPPRQWWMLLLLLRERRMEDGRFRY